MSIRTPIERLTAGEHTLTAAASHHLCRVLRLREGDRFMAFDPKARTEADGTIVEASSVAARVTFGLVRGANVIARVPLLLLYALAKGDKVDAVVRDATELGATRIVIARTSRAVAKVDSVRQVSKLERWRRVAEQASRQCGRADPPTVEGVREWREALDLAAEETEARFCLWENATEPLGPRLYAAVTSGRSLAFAIGPEGGLTAAEVEQASERGFSPVSLGRFILRTETVAAAVLGAVRVLAAP